MMLRVFLNSSCGLCKCSPQHSEGERELQTLSTVVDQHFLVHYVFV